ncbi:hypothetical protein F2P81_006219 [Scophthalmus maximus]|uniref:Retrotransposon gag domain-containing protein n=1 Tax=Scophthalmus maximus TaxID=52904 RepID=A0A6A4TBL5_SCOMX|nr:hypothetical protein F2P81_006219 [Scophthalmus maximus]
MQTDGDEDASESEVTSRYWIHTCNPFKSTPAAVTFEPCLSARGRLPGEEEETERSEGLHAGVTLVEKNFTSVAVTEMFFGPFAPTTLSRISGNSLAQTEATVTLIVSQLILILWSDRRAAAGHSKVVLSERRPVFPVAQRAVVVCSGKYDNRYSPFSLVRSLVFISAKDGPAGKDTNVPPDFQAALYKTFGPVTTDREKAQELSGMKQGSGSVCDYAIRFHTLAVESGWNSTALYDVFLKGLAAPIQDLLIPLDLPPD